MGNRHVVLAAKGGGMVFGGRLYAWGARFVLAVLLARLLGAEHYGIYNIAISVATLGAAFAVIGLDSAMIRYVAVFSRRGDRPGLVGALQVGIGLPLVVSLAGAVGVVLLADPIAGELIGDERVATPLRIAGLLVPAMVANSLLAATLQGAQRIGWAVLAEQLAQPTIRFGILVTFALMGLTAELAVLALALATATVTVLLVLFVHRQVSLEGVTGPAHRQPGLLLGFSLPVYFSNLVNTLGNNLQTLLLGALATVASAGIFGVAHQVMLVGSIFHSAIVQSSMPIFAELHDAGSRGRLEHLYRTTSKWTMTLNLPFFLLALLFPQAVLSIFGPDFVEGAPALVILAFASLANAATGTSGAMLDMTGHTRVKLLNSTASVALAIGLNLLLIPPLGVVGAAIAVLGSVSTVNLLRVAELVWLERVLPYDASWGKPLAAGVGAGLAAAGVSALLGGQPIAIQAGAGIMTLVITYAALLVLLGIGEDDRAVLSRAQQRFRRIRGGKRSEEPMGVTGRANADQQR